MRDLYQAYCKEANRVLTSELNPIICSTSDEVSEDNIVLEGQGENYDY